MARSIKSQLDALKKTMPWYGDLEWLKLSNAALRAMPSSPRQRAIKEKMALIEARYKLNKNPRKFDRCVRDVKRRGGAYNPFAVCVSTLKRRRNPSRYLVGRRARAPLYALRASKSGNVLVYVGGIKFSRHGRPVLFRTRDAAISVAHTLKRLFPLLKGWHLSVHST